MNHPWLLPTRYALWLRYTENTALMQQIGPVELTNILSNRGAIKLHVLKGRTVCEILKPKLINEILLEIYSRHLFYGWQSWLPCFQAPHMPRLKNSISNCFRMLRGLLRTTFRSIRARLTGLYRRFNARSL